MKSFKESLCTFGMLRLAAFAIPVFVVLGACNASHGQDAGGQEGDPIAAGARRGGSARYPARRTTWAARSVGAPFALKRRSVAVTLAACTSSGPTTVPTNGGAQGGRGGGASAPGAPTPVISSGGADQEIAAFKNR